MTMSPSEVGSASTTLITAQPMKKMTPARRAVERMDERPDAGDQAGKDQDEPQRDPDAGDRDRPRLQEPPEETQHHATERQHDSCADTQSLWLPADCPPRAPRHLDRTTPGRRPRGRSSGQTGEEIVQREVGGQLAFGQPEVLSVEHWHTFVVGQGEEAFLQVDLAGMGRHRGALRG